MSRFEVFDEHGRPFPPDNFPGRRALGGENPPDVLVQFRVRATGEERWSVVKATPILDADGEVLMAINVFEDVTEQKESELRERFLADAATAARPARSTTRAPSGRSRRSPSRDSRTAASSSWPTTTNSSQPVAIAHDDAGEG